MNTKILFFLIIGLYTLSAQTSFIQDSFSYEYEIDKEMTECRIKAREGELEQHESECIFQALEKWDKKLNETYKSLKEILSLEQFEKLKKAQRAWIKFKDAEMENMVTIIEFSENAGMMGMTSMINSQAIKQLNITRTRTIELINMLEELKEYTGE